MIGEVGPATRQCSRAQCRTDATFQLHWRNPRIHGADRVKVWLACPEHRDYLEGYLSSRSFPLVVTGMDDVVDRLPGAVQ